LLRFLSPLGWEHINLTGDYTWPHTTDIKPTGPYDDRQDASVGFSTNSQATSMYFVAKHTRRRQPVDKCREAEVVRREWLAEFLSRKTLPKDATQAITVGLTVHHSMVGKAIQNGNVLAHTLLGMKRANYWDADKLAALVEKTPTKAQHVSLAIVLAGIEDSTSKETWRYPNAHSARYFEQLAAWGYGLSDVERIVIDKVAENAATKAAAAAAKNAD